MVSSHRGWKVKHLQGNVPLCLETVSDDHRRISILDTKLIFILFKLDKCRMTFFFLKEEVYK